MRAYGVTFRPTTWEEVLGHKYILEILKNQILREALKNSLFAGASGCGKTTVARLVAKYLNAELIEMDAASNNGVDNIRALIESAYERSLTHKYKLVILDEAHMLTTQAWNAFLKTVEEPPKYTVFILCTTDPQKIPETILNRVQRFNFSKITPQDIIENLKRVCSKENLYFEDKALNYIARVSKGSVRESLSILGQAADLSSNLSLANVIKVVGDFTYDTFIKLTNYLLDCKEVEILTLLDTYVENGGNLKVFLNEYLAFCLEVLKYIHLQIESPSIQGYKTSIEGIINFDNPSSYYNYLTDKLVDLKNRIKQDLDYTTTVKAIFLQIARCK